MYRREASRVKHVVTCSIFGCGDILAATKKRPAADAGFQVPGAGG